MQVGFEVMLSVDKMSGIVKVSHGLLLSYKRSFIEMILNQYLQAKYCQD